MDGLDRAISTASLAGDQSASSDQLCEGCATIPWESLFSTEETNSSEEQCFEHERRFDEKAQCRSCRFFAEAVKDSFLSSEHGTPFRIRRRRPEAGLNSGFPLVILEFSSAWGVRYPLIALVTQTTSLETGGRLGKEFGDSQVLSFLDSLRCQLLPSSPVLCQPDVNIALLKSWLNVCIDEHDQACCPRPIDGLTHLRVIHCNKRTIVIAPSACRYAALSYVWGRPNKQDNSDSTDILPNVLPRTVEDAIEITVALGYSYLWVDRYCIDQSNVHAKHEQIMQMADIYAAAHITLIAAAGGDSEHGLPGVGPHPRSISSYCAVTESVRLVRLHGITPERDLGTLAKSRWASRAWTFQECYFSKRRLFFTERQIVFICGTRIHYEVDEPESFINLSLDKFDSYNDSLLPGWFDNSTKTDTANMMIRSMDVLKQYSERVLSYDTDALNAIVGALNSYTIHGVNHVCGVPWKTSATYYSSGLVDIALLWFHEKSVTHRNEFPSWSPLGWKAPIRWSWPTGDHHPYVLAEATTIRVKSNKGSHKLRTRADPEESTTEEISQYLEVEARTASLRLHIFTGERSGKLGIAIPLGDGWDAIAEVFWDLSPDEIYAHVLILEQHEDHYKRIGITRLPARFGELDCDINPFFGLKGKSGRVYTDVGVEICMRDVIKLADTEDDNLSAAWVEYLWGECFKPETIILG